MTFEKMKFLSTGKTYVEISGMSSEAKPTGYAAGSMFYETDTNKTFAFDGAEWKQTNVSGQGDGMVPNAEFISKAYGPSNYACIIRFPANSLCRYMNITRDLSYPIELEQEDSYEFMNFTVVDCQWFSRDVGEPITDMSQGNPFIFGDPDEDRNIDSMLGEDNLACLKELGVNAVYFGSTSTEITNYVTKNQYGRMELGYMDGLALTLFDKEHNMMYMLIPDCYFMNDPTKKLIATTANY